MKSIAELNPAQRVVAAAGVSNVADGIRYVALPLLALEVTNSPFLLAAVFAASMAPWLVFGLWAGEVTDRVDRKQLAQRTALVRVWLLSLLAFFIVLDAVPILVLIVAAFVLGVSEVMADNVNGALIPLLVPEADLERANSRMVGATILGNELIGPAIGGLLFAVAASLPFFTNAGLLAVAFLLLSGLPLLHAPDVGPSANDAPVDARGGMVAIRESPVLRTITWSSALLAAVDGAWFTLIALVVTNELDMSPAALGVFFAVGAVGGLIGAAIADRASGVSLAAVSTGAFLAMAGPLLLLSWLPTAFVVAFTLVMTSGAFALWNVFMVSARQRASPRSKLGRIGAAYRTVVMIAALIGTLAGGALAQLVSIRATLAAAAIVTCLAAPIVVLGFRNAVDGS